MKQKFKYLIVTFLLGAGIMFCFNIDVKAVTLNIYNGSDTPSGAGYGSCSDAWRNGFCRYSGRRGTRITVIYYDGSSYEVLGRSIDIFPSTSTLYAGTRYYNQKVNSKVALSSSVALGPSYGNEFITTKDPSMFSTDNFIPVDGNYKYATISGMPTNGSGESAFWEKLFLKDTVDASGNIIEESLGNQLIKMAREDSNASLSNKEAWDRETQEADPKGDVSKIGYRILIEPLYIWAGQTGNSQATSKLDGKYYVMTPTEYASLVWNTGNYTGAMQVNFYLSSTERLHTDFDDIGIYATTPCTGWSGGNRCLAADVQFPGTRRLGHALNIIDISKHIIKKCDYETGEGFPKDKNRGDELTDQEKECCEEKLQEIEDKYKEMGQTPEQCMLVSDSVPSFINCMAVYFRGNAEQERLWEQKKQELLEFDEKYPACSSVGCEFQPLIQIEETYVSCVQSMDTIEWMMSVIQCKDTVCEINYKSALMTYKENHLLCDLEEWEKRIPTHDCTITPICDEDNPNHFPKPGDKDPDMTCCIYFEEKMKMEYSQQGLSQAEIDKKINDWFFEPGKEFRQNCLMKSCDINDTTLTEECCDELMEAYPEYSDEFWIGKGCKPEDNDKCTWRDYADELIEHLKEMMNADCSVGSSTKLEANDTENWECIFDSDNITPGTKEEVFKDYYVKYNNPYCAVYCREDVKYDFPDGSMIVKAGNHFTVGDTGHAPEWKSVQFSSTRECKTNGSTRDEESEEINTEQFEEDWEKANDRVISTWDSWKIAQQQDWSYANSKQSPKLDCDYRCVRWGTCGNSKTGYYTCCKQKKPFGYTMYPATVYYAPFESGNQNVTPGTWCSTLGHPDPGSAAKAQTHKKAKEDMETIETDIHACTSWNEFDSYRYASFSHTDVKADRYSKYSLYKDFVDYKEFNPDLTIDYDEFTHDEYDYNDLLKKDEIPTTSDNNFSTTGKSFTIKYKCPPTVAPGHMTCQKIVVFNYSPQKEAHSTYYKEIKYTLQDGVFSTILKPQGTAANGSEYGSSSSQIYIDLGYSALHVHFMTPSGRYDIGLTYPGFTPGGNVSGGGFEHNFDKLVDDSYEYDCTYTVHNEIIENDDPNCEGDNCFPCKTDNCDPAGLKGLNLIYRPISLGEPFPGINGEGRSPGSNWNDTSLIENFITKNRGVNGNAIYQKAPMYQITLTPALIQQIRKYNESTTYNDFNMDCTAEGKECKSYFIRGNPEDSSYDFSNQFKTCSISGNRGKTNCCGIGNWNDCDDQDGITRR